MYIYIGVFVTPLTPHTHVSSLSPSVCQCAYLAEGIFQSLCMFLRRRIDEFHHFIPYALNHAFAPRFIWCLLRLIVDDVFVSILLLLLRMRMTRRRHEAGEVCACDRLQRDNRSTICNRCNPHGFIHIDVCMSTLKGPQDVVYTSEEDCDLCLCESELGSEACVWRTFIGFLANDDQHFVVMCYMIQFVPGRSYRVPSTWY